VTEGAFYSAELWEEPLERRLNLKLILLGLTKLPSDAGIAPERG
jgi:hypothetical protein